MRWRHGPRWGAQTAQIRRDVDALSAAAGGAQLAALLSQLERAEAREKALIERVEALERRAADVTGSVHHALFQQTYQGVCRIRGWGVWAVWLPPPPLTAVMLPLLFAVCSGW